MGLEIIHKRPDSPHAIPIVLLHGAWHGAWCWDAGFLDRLVESGFEVFAPSLRGHGESSGSARFANLGQYGADLASVIDSIDRPAVLVGHSMGGLITQRHIAKHPVAGAVLMGSVSPKALGGLLVIRRNGILGFSRIHRDVESRSARVQPVDGARFVFHPNHARRGGRMDQRATHGRVLHRICRHVQGGIA